MGGGGICSRMGCDKLRSAMVRVRCVMCKFPASSLNIVFPFPLRGLVRSLSMSRYARIKNDHRFIVRHKRKAPLCCVYDCVCFVKNLNGVPHTVCPI